MSTHRQISDSVSRIISPTKFRNYKRNRNFGSNFQVYDTVGGKKQKTLDSQETYYHIYGRKSKDIQKRSMTVSMLLKHRTNDQKEEKKNDLYNRCIVSKQKKCTSKICCSREKSNDIPKVSSNPPILVKQKSILNQSYNDIFNNYNRKIGKKQVKELRNKTPSLTLPTILKRPSIRKNRKNIYTAVTINDLWENIRNWNFLSEWNAVNNKKIPSGKKQNKCILELTENQYTSNFNTYYQTIPNIFQSYEQYKALWAPLCKCEGRAQVISDMRTNVTLWKEKPKEGPIRILVTPLKSNIISNSDFITLQIKSIPNDNEEKNNGPSFMANDLVLLAKDKDDIIMASKGTLESDNKPIKTTLTIDKSQQSLQKGLVGHAKFPRRSVEGLLVLVSKKIWSLVSNRSKIMYLLRLGANVTTQREFTALCQVDKMPLIDYILGKKIIPQGPTINIVNVETKNNSNVPTSQVINSHILLKNMGGKEELGKGFTKYIENKYNSSQLEAISASASEYGNGGFTLIKGPPGSGKTTTLVALLNSLHIRQFNKYFEQVRKIAEEHKITSASSKQLALSNAAMIKPRILVCAPSNAAVDNIILKIMGNGFVDGRGYRYNPSVVRVGLRQSTMVKEVSLESKVNNLLSKFNDVVKLDRAISSLKIELSKLRKDIFRLRCRAHAIKNITRWPLPKEFEIRLDFNFDQTGKAYFLNHKDKTRSYKCPSPPKPGQNSFPATAMPEYRYYISQIVKIVERYNTISTKLERYTILKEASQCRTSNNTRNHDLDTVRHQLETHILDSTHIVMTTLGTAGSRTLDATMKFEVVAIDEAAQSVEPATLTALMLGKSHAILVGDPQQLPATIFDISGRCTKYDRSLFQRLEEAGHTIHLLDIQYRMHPAISSFPRRIFYGGYLKDGPNVVQSNYGNPLKETVHKALPAFKPLTILDLDSSEERENLSMTNSSEAHLALHLYNSLSLSSDPLVSQIQVAIITPYSQQVALLKKIFSRKCGRINTKVVDIDTVDSFQGREANIVIFSCVRASGSNGIGFLSDVRRMNVALTRAKYFLIIIARCNSISVNPYWRDFVNHAREKDAVIRVPYCRDRQHMFPSLRTLKPPLLLSTKQS